MNAYLSLMKTRYLNNLQYRAAAVSGCLTQVAWGLIHVLVFWAFYQTGADAPMSMQAVVSYTWLRQAFLALFMTWYYDREIMESIQSGSIAIDLCRPIDLYPFWFVKTLAVRFARASLRCVPILLLAFLLPNPIGLALPAGPGACLLFLLTMLLGVLVLTAVAMPALHVGLLYALDHGLRTGFRRCAGISLRRPDSPALFPEGAVPDSVLAAVRRDVERSVPHLFGDLAGRDMVFADRHAGVVAFCAGIDRRSLDPSARSGVSSFRAAEREEDVTMRLYGKYLAVGLKSLMEYPGILSFFDGDTGGHGIYDAVFHPLSDGPVRAGGLGSPIRRCSSAMR